MADVHKSDPASNCGIESNVKSGDSWAHECPVTPSHVFCGCKGNTPVADSWDWDNTNITYYHDGLGGQNVVWWAIYPEEP